MTWPTDPHAPKRLEISTFTEPLFEPYPKHGDETEERRLERTRWLIASAEGRFKQYLEMNQAPTVIKLGELRHLGRLYTTYLEILDL